MSDVSEKELERRAKQLRKIAGSRKCIRSHQEGDTTVLTFDDQQVFRCKGPVVDRAVILYRGRRGIIF